MYVVGSASRCFFFFNDTATTEIYTLSLHDALPILAHQHGVRIDPALRIFQRLRAGDDEIRVANQLFFERADVLPGAVRSEEHTSELQSQSNLVCRLLLEKKNSQSQKHGVPSSRGTS